MKSTQWSNLRVETNGALPRGSAGIYARNIKVTSQHNMEERKIKCWHELAVLPDEFKTKSWIFRGVEDSSYNLVPKIGRPNSRKNLDGTDAGYSSDAETLAIERFQRETRPHLGIEPRSTLDWLSLAQHHGLPTRLLDWTESPLIAAYFALRPTGIINGI